MDITKIDFHWNGKTYEIRISLENGDLAHGDFLAEAYLDGKKAFSAVRENAMQALTGAMEKGTHPFVDIITMLQCNIKQGFNKAA